MKILFLANVVPVPCDDGRKLRQLAVLRALSKKHDVTLLSFAEQPPGREAIAALARFSEELSTVPLRVARIASTAGLAAKARCLLTGSSFSVQRYAAEAMQTRVRQFLSRGDFDLVWCDSLHMSINLPPALHLPSVLSLHNVESQVLARYCQLTRNPLLRLIGRREQRSLERYEGAAYPRFNHVVVCSPADQAVLRAWNGFDNSTVVPNAIDTQYYCPSAGRKEPDSLVFTGALDWFPNRDAIEFFLSQVFPLIRKDIPGVRFTIVGRNPSPAMERLARRAPGISLTGHVTDTRPFIRSATLSVVPIRIGGGTRLKILEALAMERPVVSTTLGAEGLDLKHGRDIAIADSPEEFARQTVRLLRDPGLRHRLAECGRGIVLEKYSLTNVEAAVEEALAKVFRGGGKDNLRGPVLQRGSTAFSHAQAAEPALTGSVRPKLDSRAVGDAVRRVTTEVIHTIFPSDVAAIVLTGSLARGEASVLCSNGVAKVLGDVEFVIVFREHVPLPRLERFRPVREQIESRLRTLGIQCHLDFSSVRKNFFERQRHHIFGYELGVNGKTIWGDPSILDSLQPVSARDIPQEDAWRMLCNRIIEQLRALIPVFRTESYRCEEILYELVKFKLDQATSLLVFLDEYEPTYRRRAEKIASLAQSGEYPALPFSLKALADRTRDATDIKLHPRIDALLIRPSNSTNLRAELLRRLAEPVPLVRALWEWELGRMLEREKTSDSRNGGWETWLGRQNALGRYRSWSHLLWHSRANLSPREWGRTLRLMGHGSPRYLTYVAGSLLYFSLPAVLEKEEKTVRAVVEKSRKLLPAIRQSGRQPVSWLDACQEVVWNYESFLVRTRS